MSVGCLGILLMLVEAFQPNKYQHLLAKHVIF